MEKITDILLAEVHDESGRYYGRLFELRSDGEPEHGLVSNNREITAFLCATHGILQELGFKPTDVSTITWDSVVEIKRGKITIRPKEKPSE